MYITNKTRTDGFGAQYQCIIFTILFADLMGLEFVYTPFEKMEHNYDDDSNFLEKKEKLINILNNYKNKKDVEPEKIKDFDIGHIYNTVESNLDYCLSTETFYKIRKLFHDNKTNIIKEKTLNIHIRRPNKFDIGDYGYTEDEYFLNILKKIQLNHPDIKKIKIHSQGDEFNFSRFNNQNIDICLNKPIEETFTDLVNSDILVMSKSSFSYTAGLLCDGIVYYLPFWHKPRKTWITL